MNQLIVAFITGLTTGGLSCLAVQGGLLTSSLEQQGIKQVTASYQRGQMSVEFDEAKVSEAQIFAAVEKRGYTARAA